MKKTNNYKDEENAIISIKEMMPKPYEKYAVLGFTLAIWSLLLNFYGTVSLTALILSIMALIKIKKDNSKGLYLARYGLMIGIISFLFGIYTIITTL